VTSSPVGVRSVAVLVATFRRPDSLGLLLASLRDVVGRPPEGWRVRIVVCDNDPDGSAFDVCAAHETVEYVHEPRPGIAAARNALVEAAAGDDAIAFIDDDERPDPGWLDALVDASERFAADVVTGPVLNDFEVAPPSDLASSFERRRWTTGDRVPWPRTGNVLIRRPALEDPPLRFRDSYGLSGGSDSLLFIELERRGIHAVWADDAVVRERVPASRTTLRWVLRRSFRLGNTHTRFDRDLDGRIRTMAVRAAKAVGWILTGAVATVAATARGDGRGRVRGMERLWRGAGMLAGLGGHRHLEYRRR